VVRVAPDGHDLAEALERDVDDEAIERAQAHVHAHHRWEHRADVIYDVLTREPGADAGPGNAEGPPVAGLRGRTG
jgi:hypothetical protein